MEMRALDRGLMQSFRPCRRLAMYSLMGTSPVHEPQVSVFPPVRTEPLFAYPQHPDLATRRGSGVQNAWAKAIRWEEPSAPTHGHPHLHSPHPPHHVPDDRPLLIMNHSLHRRV